MHCGCRCPGKLFVRAGFDERHEARGLLQHGGSDIDELVQTVWPGKHPTHAVWTEIMAVHPLRAAQDRRSPGGRPSFHRACSPPRTNADPPPLAAAPMT